MSLGIIVGNPKPDSRTLDAAKLVATRLGLEPEVTIDVVTLGSGLLGWNDPQVVDAVQRIRGCRTILVASPTFKATYTGLLKLFLDQFPANGLAGVTAFPMMLGAGPYHALAPELLLKPVLVELGATCPVRGLYLLDSDYAGAASDAWIALARPFVSSLSEMPGAA